MKLFHTCWTIIVLAEILFGSNGHESNEGRSNKNIYLNYDLQGSEFITKTIETNDDNTDWLRFIEAFATIRKLDIPKTQRKLVRKAMNLVEKRIQSKIMETAVRDLKAQVEARSFDPVRSDPRIINLLKSLKNTTIYGEVVRIVMKNLDNDQMSNLISFITENGQISYILTVLKEKLLHRKSSMSSMIFDDFQLVIAENIFHPKAGLNFTNKMVRDLLALIDEQPKLLYNETAAGLMFIQFQEDKSYLSYDLDTGKIFVRHQNDDEMKWHLINCGARVFKIKAINSNKVLTNEDLGETITLGQEKRENDDDFTQHWEANIFDNEAITLRSLIKLKYICRNETISKDIVLEGNSSAACRIKLIKTD